jgi:hypothetical protein
MSQEQKQIFLARTNARLVAGLWPQDPEAGQAALLEMIAEEEQRLEALLEEHLERMEPIVDTGFDAGDEAERLRRYQAECDRGLLRVLEALRKRRRDAERAAAAAAKAAKASKQEEMDQWNLIRRVVGVMERDGKTTGKRAADPMASVGVLAPNVGRPAATNEPRPAPPTIPAAATNEAKPAPPTTTSAATNEANAPARAAGSAFSAVVTVILALTIGLAGAVLERSNPTAGSGRRTDPTAATARDPIAGIPSPTRGRPPGNLSQNICPDRPEEPV